MSQFRSFGAHYGPTDLDVLQHAYDDACMILALDPAPADDNKSVRNSVADAILEAAKIGERDPARLTAFAVAIGSAAGNSRIRRTRHVE